VTVTLFRSILLGPLPWQIGPVCGVRHYKRRVSLVRPDPQAIVTMIFQNLWSV